MPINYLFPACIQVCIFASIAKWQSKLQIAPAAVDKSSSCLCVFWVKSNTLFTSLLCISPCYLDWFAAFGKQRNTDYICFFSCYHGTISISCNLSFSGSNNCGLSCKHNPSSRLHLHPCYWTGIQLSNLCYINVINCYWSLFFIEISILKIMQQLLVNEVTSTSSAPNAELEYSSPEVPLIANAIF